MPRRLIVNADDFGYTQGVNAGIIKAHREGILTSTTLMAAGPAFDDAAARARETPTLDVGCHITLVELNSTLHPDTPLPGNWRGLLFAAFDVEGEMRAQIEKLLQAGVRISHLDTHKHTQLLPRIARAMTRVAKEFGVRYARRPADTALEVPVRSWKRRMLSRTLSPLAMAHGLQHTDAFIGFEITGMYDAALLCQWLKALPEGVTELMTHPGFYDASLDHSQTRLRASRQQELDALTNPTVRTTLQQANIQLTRWSELP
jgi:chitin disaccharide deacetylase